MASVGATFTRVMCRPMFINTVMRCLRDRMEINMGTDIHDLSTHIRGKGPATIFGEPSLHCLSHAD